MFNLFKMSLNHFNVVLCSIMFAATLSTLQAQSALHDSVPYQDDPLLTLPLTGQLIDNTSNSELILDCDWPTLMSMIRDLEERISTALEVDTTYGVYVSGEVTGNTVSMWHDCYVLRDSILSLQIQLDEALASEPGMMTLLVSDIAQTVATIKGAVIDDGNVELLSWGFIYGTDSLLTSPIPDSVNVPFGTYQAFLDTSTLDTGRYELALSDLTRYTKYYYTAVGANEEGPGYGDTLSFTTLPDLASGFTLDTSNVTSTTVILKVYIDDAGGQGPDSAGFAWDTSNFTVLDSAASNQLSTGTLTFADADSAGYTLNLTGLTRYTDHYFNAYADNLAGRSDAGSTMTFKTKPDAPILGTSSWDSEMLTLTGKVTDLGGDNGLPLPSATGSIWSVSSDLSSPSATIPGTFQSSDSTFATSLTGLLDGKNYYGGLFATNLAGTAWDTIPFTTLVGVSTDSASAITVNDATLYGCLDFDDALTSMRYEWSENADLSASSDSTVTYADGVTVAVPYCDDQFSMQVAGLTRYTDYYYTLSATNSEGTAYGDTLSFTTMPELPTFDTIYYDVSIDSLVAVLLDNGGQQPTAQKFRIDTDAALETAVDLAANVNGLTIMGYAAGAPGSSLHGYASATNLAGTVHSDTISWVTLVEVTTYPDAADPTVDSGTLLASFAFADAVPSAVGFKWGLAADLSDAMDSTLVMEADSTVQMVLTGLQEITTYYYTCYATNAGGTAYADTLSFSTKIRITDDNIHSAVNLWIDDEAAATVTYGHISNWNTSAVTNMVRLFDNKSTFNDDIRRISTTCSMALLPLTKTSVTGTWGR
jgi:hypothetical protein